MTVTNDCPIVLAMNIQESGDVLIALRNYCEWLEHADTVLGNDDANIREHIRNRHNRMNNIAIMIDKQARKTIG